MQRARKLVIHNNSAPIRQTNRSAISLKIVVSRPFEAAEPMSRERRLAARRRNKLISLANQQARLETVERRLNQ